MNHGEAQPVPIGDMSSSAVRDRRQSERSEVTRPCVYVFNEAQGETLTMCTGAGLVQDMSAGGMCVQLDQTPKDHGVLEVRTAGPGAGWVWLLGITWTREIPGPDRPTSFVGGRFLFGCCTN